MITITEFSISTQGKQGISILLSHITLSNTSKTIAPLPPRHLPRRTTGRACARALRRLRRWRSARLTGWFARIHSVIQRYRKEGREGERVRETVMVTASHVHVVHMVEKAGLNITLTW